MIYIQYRHPVYRRILGFPRGRIQYIVCAYNYRRVRFGKVRIYILHLVQVFIIYVCFAQQYVHMPRHPPGYRVHGISHSRTSGSQLIRKLLHQVLRLCYRHTVPGNYYNVFSLPEYLYGIFLLLAYGCLCRKRFFLFDSIFICGSVFCGSFPQQYIKKLSVHRSAHYLSQKKP